MRSPNYRTRCGLAGRSSESDSPAQKTQGPLPSVYPARRHARALMPLVNYVESQLLLISEVAMTSSAYRMLHDFVPLNTLTLSRHSLNGFGDVWCLIQEI